MTQKQNELLERYADRKESIRLLEMEVEMLEPKVLAYLDKEGVDTLKEAYGTFSVVNRKKWTYTPELIEKKKQYDTIIKAKQTEEQESGEAKAEEVKGLSYRVYEEK
jgi:hypothetical protein